jgi:hypothetical protein
MGVLFVAISLSILAAAEFWPANRPADGSRWLERKIKMGLQSGTLAWAGVSIVVWLTGWATQFSTALRAVH